MDSCWAVLGEIYGRFNERSLGLTIRRVRSNIEEREEFGRQAGYIPDDVRFTAADANLIQLLIKPLYGDYPGIAVRELVQNSVDACRERAFLEQGASALDHNDFKVEVSTAKAKGGRFVLSIEDNGIGMDLQILKRYFLNAGASYRGSLAWKKMFTDQRRHSLVLRSGRFGVGALAAFLLADDPRDVKIRVHTRRHNASKTDALYFESSLSQRPISVSRKVKDDFGTRIEIETTNPPPFISSRSEKDIDSNSDAWDWYCLDWPLVKRKAINGTSLEPRHRLPASSAFKKGTFRWLAVTDFQDVGWTYASAPAVVCNGILVMEEYSYKFSAPKLLQTDGLVSKMEVPMPNLIVFDKDGKLPLTLDRLRLDFDQLSFLGALQRSVAVDFFIAVLVSAPESCSRKAIEASKRIFGKIIESDSKLDWNSLTWLFHKDGVAPFFKGSVEALKFDDIVEMSEPESLKYVSSELSESVGICFSQYDRSLYKSDHIDWNGKHCYMYLDEEEFREAERFERRLRDHAERSHVRMRSVSDRRAAANLYRDFIESAIEQIVRTAHEMGSRERQSAEHLKEEMEYIWGSGEQDPVGVLRRLYDLLRYTDLAHPEQSRIFEIVDRCMHEGIELSNSMGRTFGELVMSGSKRPRTEKRFQETHSFVDGSKVIDWDAVPVREGDKSWFLAHWRVGQLPNEKELPYEKIWQSTLSEVFVSCDWEARKAVISKLAMNDEFAPHLERALAIRQSATDEQ